jgi:hypothetical protein
MKTKIRVLKVVLAGVVALMSAQAQADIIKNYVRLGAFQVNAFTNSVPLTTSGFLGVSFNGSGRFTIWYTAECAASGYVDIDIYVDGIPVGPTGDNTNDSFCDFNTRGAMHTVTGRTGNLVAGSHLVDVYAHVSDGVAFLSDSSLLIGK